MGKYLQELTYLEAREVLNEETIVVIPAGGGSKEHGPHLPMGTDMYITDYLAKKLTEKCDVITLPTLNFGFYPAFVEWEGSISLRAETFIDCLRDIILSIARTGVRKFFIIDGGVSTHAPIKILSANMYNDYGLRVASTVMYGLGREMDLKLVEQEEGGHADEIETSWMLHIAPELVHMDLAPEEYDPVNLDMYLNGEQCVSMFLKMETKSGVEGNAKLATKEKGEMLLDAMVEDMLPFLKKFKEYQD